MTSIEGKVVVITGASSGLGEATARLLASRGAKVFLGARRADRLEAVASDIVRGGGTAGARAVDVTKRHEVEALVRAALERFGRVDVLVSNAGLMARAPLAKARVEEWDRMIDVNVKGVLYGVAAVLPVFQRQGGGHFITLSSVAGLKVSRDGAVYSATKFAVRAIAEGLRQELGAAIRSTIISPGVVESELPLGSGDPESLAKVKELYAKHAIPADSVARAIAFAIEQPADVDVNEVVLRPTAQEF